MPFASSVLTRVADVEGTYEAFGLNCLTLTPPEATAVLSNLRSESAEGIDAGGLAITPVVAMIGAGLDPVIIATTYRSDTQARLATFAKNGITADAATLKGKKVGFASNTIGDIYLSRLLEEANLERTDIVSVSAKPAQLKSLLVQGDLDAAVIWDPLITIAKRDYARGLAEGKLEEFFYVHTPDRRRSLSPVLSRNAAFDES